MYQQIADLIVELHEKSDTVFNEYSDHLRANNRAGIFIKLRELNKAKAEVKRIEAVFPDEAKAAKEEREMNLFASQEV